MRRAILPIAACLAALGLSACNKTQTAAASAGNGICKPFTTSAATPPAAAAPGQAQAPLNGAPAAGGADPAAPLDDCLHRWGYTLAASTDPANYVAAAAVAACSDALADWNRGSLSADNAGGAVQAPSLMTGETTNPMAEHFNFAQGRALFYVVQARAGHCGPPPATPAPRS
jgi:hypothetical protein